MKKMLMFIFIGLMMFGLVGCSKNDSSKEKELEDRISTLESQIEALLEAMGGSSNEQLTKLQDEVRSLQKSNALLVDSNKQHEKREEELENSLAEMEAYVEELNRKFNSAGLVDSSIAIHLAKEYHLVVGDTFQLFYRSIVQAVDPYGYYIRLKGTVGHAYNRYYEFQPQASDAGKTYDLTVEVCDSNGNVFGTASTKLVINRDKVQNPVTKNILCVGDSLTANGVWVNQGATRYKTAGGQINLLGTVTSGGAKHEGHGGWQWSSYINDGDSPFKSTTTSTNISFKEYCDRNGYTQLDEVYFLLTWNGVGGSFREFSFASEPFKSAKVVVDQLHSEYPNVKITLLAIPLPSVNAGLGAYYTLNQSYGDNYGQLVTAMNYDDFLQAWAEDENYKSFLRYEDSKGQFDSEYNMPTEGKNVNNQNPTQEQVGNAMGMHPSNNGYKQIGDAFFRALMHEWK